MELRRKQVVFVIIIAWSGAALGTACADTDSASPGAQTQPVPQRMSREMSARIDERVEARGATADVALAPIVGDGEFLRRACLDLNGVIPRVGEVREFLADVNPEKRAEMIDRLLDSPRYSTHMATVWRNRILPLDVGVARGPQAVALQKWLRSRFAKNLRYDNLVGEMLLTLGGDDLGPALYYQANDVSPEKLATSAAELFMGVHLQCAQCHDHPTADWTQHDFWGLAAFFARVRAPRERDNRMGISYRLEDTDQGEVRLPNSNDIIPPKFPGGVAVMDESDRTRRMQLALWLTSRENGYFARAAVNWAWSQLFGQGIVDSLDDETAAAADRQLLDELAKYFVESDYDLRELWRTLANTRAYQRASYRGDSTDGMSANIACMHAKPLSPEQLYDSIAILGALERDVAALNAPGAADVNPNLLEDPGRAEFIRRMRPPPGGSIEYRAGTLQALLMMNGRTMTAVTADKSSGLLTALDAPFLSDRDRVEAVFLAALAREPSSDESTACLAAFAQATDHSERNKALSDVLWALVNSTEFAFNH